MSAITFRPTALPLSELPEYEFRRSEILVGEMIPRGYIGGALSEGADVQVFIKGGKGCWALNRGESCI